MRLKRYECVIENGSDTITTAVITNATTFGKGTTIKIKGTDWTVKTALPADTDHVQFGDVVHEVKL